MRQRAQRVARPVHKGLSARANDEPRPYSELLERLGNGEQLPDLIWLAGHGCAAEPELSEAVMLVNAYQDSPGRAAMLATLTQLRSRH
jgi:hypothetical protein